MIQQEKQEEAQPASVEPQTEPQASAFVGTPPEGQAVPKTMMEILSTPVPQQPVVPEQPVPAATAHSPSIPVISGQATPNIHIEQVPMPFGKNMVVTVEVHTAQFKDMSGGVITQRLNRLPANISAVAWKDASGLSHAIDPLKEWEDTTALHAKVQALEEQNHQLLRQVEVLKTPDIEGLLRAATALKSAGLELSTEVQREAQVKKAIAKQVKKSPAGPKPKPKQKDNGES